MIKKALFSMLVLSLLVPTVSLAKYDYNSKVFQSIVSQLDMQGHSKDDLSTCSVKQMYFKEVLKMLNEEGMSEEEIIQYYVEQYGQAALKEPELGKNGIIAWTMPAVGVVIGALIMGYWLKKRKGNEKQQIYKSVRWESEIEKDIAEKIFEEERYKQF